MHKQDMNFLNHIFKRHSPIAFSILVILAFAVIVKVFAVSGGPFNAAETLDPDCVPGGTCQVNIFPDQAGNSGKFLKTNGSAVSWAASSGGISGLVENYLPKSQAGGTSLINSSVFDNGTNVGIGTTSPGAKLDVFTTVPGGNILVLRSEGFFPDTGYNLSFSSNPNPDYASIVGTDEDNDKYGHLSFWTKDNDTSAERMTILSGGNVGIGTVSPSEKLDVAGNLRFSGALMPNNSAGTAGQVLTSAGAGSPPTWATAGGATDFAVRIFPICCSANTEVTLSIETVPAVSNPSYLCAVNSYVSGASSVSAPTIFSGNGTNTVFIRSSSATERGVGTVRCRVTDQDTNLAVDGYFFVDLDPNI